MFLKEKFYLICLQIQKKIKIVKYYYNLKGSSDTHFPQVDMILWGLNEKSITYFG